MNRGAAAVVPAATTIAAYWAGSVTPLLGGWTVFAVDNPPVLLLFSLLSDPMAGINQIDSSPIRIPVADSS